MRPGHSALFALVWLPRHGERGAFVGGGSLQEKQVEKHLTLKESFSRGSCSLS